MAGDFQIDGGNVKFIDDASMAGKFLVIYRSTPVTQLTDFIDNGNYSLEDIERALDKLTFMIQERTGTPVGTYINVGVSLFFASILQLTNKADFLNNIFTWTDIDDGDKPGIAGKIRRVVDLISKSGGTNETPENIDGYKSFTNPPRLAADPSDSTDATRKSYVDGYFPVATANIGNSQVTTGKLASGAVTTAKLDQSAGSQAVTTATIRDGAVTTAKLNQTSGSQAVTTATIRDANVTFAKLRKGSATVTMTASGDNYAGTWSNGGNKMLYGISGTGTTCQQIRSDSGGVTYYFSKPTSGNITVYYIY